MIPGCFFGIYSYQYPVSIKACYGSVSADRIQTEPHAPGLIVVQHKTGSIGPTAGTECQYISIHLTAAHGSQILERSVGYRHVGFTHIIIYDLMAGERHYRICAGISVYINSDYPFL